MKTDQECYVSNSVELVGHSIILLCFKCLLNAMNTQDLCFI